MKKGSPLELPLSRLVERPVAQALCLNGRKEVKTIMADLSEPPEFIKRQNMAMWLHQGISRNLRFPVIHTNAFGNVSLCPAGQIFTANAIHGIVDNIRWAEGPEKSWAESIIWGLLLETGRPTVKMGHLVKEENR